MDGFPFVHRETVRFRDLDGMGHVNNAVFSTYLEQARLAWFGETDEHAARRRDPRAHRDRLPVAGASGEIVEIGVRPSRVGTKSFELEYELRAAGGSSRRRRASSSATTTGGTRAGRSRIAGKGG